MPKNIEEWKREHRRSAAAGVVMFALLQLMSAVLFAALCLTPGLPKPLLVLFAGLAVLSLALLLPTPLLLKRRFKEIEGGELYDACKY